MSFGTNNDSSVTKPKIVIIRKPLAKQETGEDPDLNDSIDNGDKPRRSQMSSVIVKS